MGYGTRYELKAEYAPHNEPAYVVARFVQENQEAGYALSDDGSTNNSDAKWYEHADDLKKLSAANPHLLFVLNGWGQDKEDIWVEYYHAGKMQRETAALVLGAFDPKKLK